MNLLDPDPRFEPDRVAEACSESWQIWHAIAAAALRSGNVPLAYSAVVEHGIDVDRITSW